MASKFSLHLLSAAMLAAALLLCGSAPLEDGPTDGSSGDFSGEREEEFEEEFGGIVDYRSLENYKRPSFPRRCPKSNVSREACFKKLTKGLLVYTVLLKHTEKEYPNNLILPKIRAEIPQLILLIKGRMKNGEAVTALTSSQEETLLKELDSPDTFRRRMTAHSVLYFLRPFLIDGLRSFRKWQPRNATQTNVTGANCLKGPNKVKAG
ncbi:interleukin-6-like [Cololabis saira]|uniref:interleukin-6-like n=1 Tax=Cololabis saira TaxID=129043 RepID=UPI002AD5A044|nr:interleukin-6-like [Cololabis saira]